MTGAKRSKALSAHYISAGPAEGGLGARLLAHERIQRAIKVGEGHQHFHHTAYIIASAYARMNKTEPAMKFLRRAAEDGFPCYPLYNRDPDLNNLRKDPRFMQFMSDLKKQWEH